MPPRRATRPPDERVAESVEADDRFFQRVPSLAQSAGLTGSIGPAQEDERKAGIPLRRERLRAFEQLERLPGVEAERTLPGEQGVASRRAPGRPASVSSPAASARLIASPVW